MNSKTLISASAGWVILVLHSCFCILLGFIVKLSSFVHITDPIAHRKAKCGGLSFWSALG